MKRLLVNIFWGGLVFVAVIAAVTVGRALTLESQQPAIDSSTDLPRLRSGAVERFAGAIRIPSVSPQAADAEALAPFDTLHTYLETQFPKTHQTLRREVVPPCNLLYTWEADSPEHEPAVFMSHLDVVPVEDPEAWRHPPFSGAVADGYVWGRGTLDVKQGALAILEATETLIDAGIEPARDLVYAFGCDEEIGGHQGAKKLARRLAERGLQAEYVLDEGMAIVDGVMPGVKRPVALVGLAEKGFLTLELTAAAAGGHASMPPPSTAIGILAKAVASLEEEPFPTRLSAPARAMFASVAPAMPFAMKLVFGNLWIFEPVLLAQMAAKKQTNATVRTTTAVTMIRGGVQDNVLPKTARARVNFRIAPGETIASVIERVKRVIDDPRVRIKKPEASFTSNPSPVSSPGSEAFAGLRRVVRQVFGEDVLVGPGLTVGGTDSRYFTELAQDVYRFMPMVLRAGDTERIHGVNERLGVENYRDMVRYYMLLMQQ